MPDFPVTVFHNPACGTSRKVLALIETAGHTPRIVHYLKTGWTKAQLEAVFATMKVAPRDLLRAKEPLALELGLTDLAAGGDKILAAMVAHPILVNRPIVQTPLGVALCRPAETVMALIAPQKSALTPRNTI